MRRIPWLPLILLAASPALATDACRARAAAAFPDHRPAPATAERTSVSARGDFDGDGAADTALLLQPLGGTAKLAAAVCLSGSPGGQPMLIEDIYTAGNLSTKGKGSRYVDYDTEQAGVYERDGINSYCCGCCGATYVLRNGAFVQVVDSD